MDTKLKKSDSGFARRFVAVLLFTMMLFSNSFSFAKLARETVLFGTPALTKANEPFTQTTSFAAETEALMSYLSLTVSADTDISLLESKLDSIKNEYAMNIARYDEIVSDCYLCGAMAAKGEYLAEPEADAPSTQQGYWYYRFVNSGYDDIESYAADMSGYDYYLYEVKEAKSNYADIDERIYRFVRNTMSMKFYIINNKTGKYHTNIEGCTTGEQASAVVKGCGWYALGSKDLFESNDTRPYSSSKDQADFYSWIGFAPDCSTVYSEILIEKDSLVTVSPYYWFKDAFFENNDCTLYLGYSPVASATDGFASLDREYSSYSFSKKDSAVMVCLAAGCLALFIYLLSTTGRQRDGSPKKYFIDWLWNDVHMGLTFTGCGLLGALAVSVAAGMATIVITNPVFYAAVCAVCFTLIVLLLTEWLTSVVRNVRMKTFFRHTFCWKVIALCAKPFVALFKYGRELILVKNMPKWTSIAFGAALGMNLLLGILAAGSNSGVPVFLMFLLDTALLAAFVKAFVSLCGIMKTVEQAKDGNPAAKVDLSKTFFLYRDFARNVNTVNDGIQKAVDSAVRDQKTKTELITNVSHDLKTPLTSIVSYVDLLKRCGIKGEEANKYIDILDEKSQRLKKLVEDLVEASKVSSGAVELHPVKLNLCEMAVQAVGENCEILEKDGIETVYNSPKNPVFIMADGQKTSRVIENLFSNVCKYAMPGTRVYVDVTCNGRFGALTIKNISRFPLNISAEELKQRFVRGDESRSSEGSGLGLSIAQNLCNLQGGGCDIDIDGDLFKVTVFFPQIQQ